MNLNECASNRTDSINTRMSNRNIPSQPLQPYLSVRSVQTKYSIMPIVDPRSPINTVLRQQPVYNISNTFNPGSSMSPWSGYATNVNTESELRNQIYALQSCSQSVYVPSSKSDLYDYSFKPKSVVNQQPFPHLFQKDYFKPFNPNPERIGEGIFQNCTRQQLKDVKVCK
jgi:hypothetical protein